MENSGLKEILETCSIATIEVGAVADVSQIKRAPHCAQVTLCALYQKLVETVKKEGSLGDPYEWLSEKEKCSRICYCWKMVLDLEIEILIFARSMKERNFSLYVQSLRALVFFFLITSYL